RIPERKLPPGVRVDHHLMQGIMKVQDVPKVEVLRRKNRIRKEQNSRDHEHHRVPEIRIPPPARRAASLRYLPGILISRPRPPGPQEIETSGSAPPTRGS